MAYPPPTNEPPDDDDNELVTKAERQERLLSIIGIGHSGVPDLATNHDHYLALAYGETDSDLGELPPPENSPHS